MTTFNFGSPYADDYLSPTQVSRTTTQHVVYRLPLITTTLLLGHWYPVQHHFVLFLATIQPWIATDTTGQLSLRRSISPQFSDTHHVRKQDNYPEELDITTLH